MFAFISLNKMLNKNDLSGEKLLSIKLSFQIFALCMKGLWPQIWDYFSSSTKALFNCMQTCFSNRLECIFSNLTASLLIVQQKLQLSFCS